MPGLYQDYALAAAGGLLLAAGFWPQASCAWSGWIALVPYLWVIHGKNPRQAFGLGWLYGTAAWMAGVYWMPAPMAFYLKLPAAPGWFAFTLLWGFHGLVFALAAWLTSRLGGSSPLRFSLTFVPLAVAGEGFFPMLLPPVLAYTQHSHLPGLQSMELFGPAGLAWLIAGFNAAVFAALRGWREGRLDPGTGVFLAAAGALALANEGYGYARMRQVDAQVAAALRQSPLKVALIQGSLPVGQARIGRAALSVQERLTGQAAARSDLDLVIWPESTFGYPVESEDGKASVAGMPVQDFLRRNIPHPVSMLFNVREVSPEQARASGGPARGFNSALLVGPEHEFLGLARKRVLFPFGEFVPGADWLPFLYRLSPRSYALSAGGPPRLLAAPGGERIGVLICYEDLQPELARDYSALGANLLVNMTEDMLLGSAGAEQHLMGGVPRAIESRKFLLRAANFGVTAVVDPVGRVVARLPPGARDALIETVALMPGSTPYARLGRFLYYLALPVLAGTARKALKT